ncbi:MAG: DUF2809 domain-containing protein [Chitinophagaceae bacterium]|nr:MAG: DUF2809 domain-containing protein [Chitinophagaceae bacterium]
MLTFRPRYFLLALLLFLMEVLIALYVNDWLIRPYGGDYLVVILLYCALRAFVNVTPWKGALAVLLFAYAIETAQYFELVRHLGLSHNRLARTVIGTGFEWKDLVAYTLGIGTVLLLEYCVPVTLRLRSGRQ